MAVAIDQVTLVIAMYAVGYILGVSVLVVPFLMNHSQVNDSVSAIEFISSS